MEDLSLPEGTLAHYPFPVPIAYAGTLARRRQSVRRQNQVHTTIAYAAAYYDSCGTALAHPALDVRYCASVWCYACAVLTSSM
eukprot:2282323-Rhodomonas_salina.1